MTYITVFWDDENLEHVADHGVSPEEVEDVLLDPDSRFTRSRSTGRPAAFGFTRTGRHLFVAFEEIDELTVYPITAYDVPEPGE